MFIFAQILGFIATAILLTYTVITVSRKTVLICNIIINALWALHYLILGAYTGAFCSLLTSIMVFASFFKGKNKFFKKPTVPIMFSVFFIITAIFTWAGFSSVIQIIGNIILTIAMWREKEIEIKALFIPVGVLWFIYSVIFFSPIGLISQAMSISFNVYYVVKNIKMIKKVY